MHLTMICAYIRTVVTMITITFASRLIQSLSECMLSAIKMIKKSLEFQKESKYYFNLAYCYAMKQESNKALIYFNLAWALDSSDLDCEKAIKLILSKNKKAL